MKKAIYSRKKITSNFYQHFLLMQESFKAVVNVINPVKAVILFFIVISFPLHARAISCLEFDYLVIQSKSGFYAIQSDVKSAFGGFEATRKLSDARYCAIIEDVEKRTYSCRWEYALGDRTAYLGYEKIAADILMCLGDSTVVTNDQLVNHPDTYKSYLYSVSDVDVRVTFKDKRKLKRTFVSVFIEGRHVSKVSK